MCFSLYLPTPLSLHLFCSFSQVACTLLPALSVGCQPTVGWSVYPLFGWSVLWSKSAFLASTGGCCITAPVKMLGWSFITAPAHLEATWVAMYPALLNSFLYHHQVKRSQHLIPVCLSVISHPFHTLFNLNIF